MLMTSGFAVTLVRFQQQPNSPFQGYDQLVSTFWIQLNTQLRIKKWATDDMSMPISFVFIIRVDELDETSYFLIEAGSQDRFVLLWPAL
jgi:hypothetical protein